MFAATAVAVSGIPLCIVIAPLLLGALLIAAHLVDLLAPLGDAQWAVLHDAIFVGPTIYRKLTGQATAVSWRALALIYVVPGSVLVLVAWPFVRLLSRSVGAGSLLHRLQARPPDLTRVVEQQIVNVVAEMAVAAGVSPPAVRVIDSATVNAVAIGLSIDDTTLLVTSGFLERLDRDERQAMIAHLVGSVGNGDLEIAATIFSVFETWALVATLLETPLSAGRRAFIRKFARLAVEELRGGADAREVRAVVDSLLAGIGPDAEDVITTIERISPKSALDGCFIILVQIPLMAVLGLGTIVARESTNLVVLLVLGPWLAAMWRARRGLADATAVQLTRNPSALARAVRTLAACDVEVPGGWPVHFLFPVWVTPTDARLADTTSASANLARMQLPLEPRLRRLAALGASMAPTGHVRFWTRFRSAMPEWNELWRTVGLALLVVVGLGLLMAVTVLSASLLLIVLWYLVRWVMTPLRWLRR